jgi:hypothetical protein
MLENAFQALSLIATKKLFSALESLFPYLEIKQISSDRASL